eukprot:CAMPEP_0119470986 /NCGR_PEP_ID=MMETSP1344-20130328/3645_1 /TAXON_ID=236787 /ORGANISM="Florenciella parvula, Strain CCMP2471" /LENGTH=363 /DNA_ID=CAMNT_0007503721 /DNA_START=639 /DNA_END=1727 /DNA_ORIENTATION=-
MIQVQQSEQAPPPARKRTRYDIEITTALSGQTISDLPEVMRRGYNARFLPKLPGIIGLDAGDVKRDVEEIEAIFEPLEHEMDPYADPNAAYGGMYQSAHGAPPQGGPRQGMHYNQGHQPYLQGPPPDHMRGGYSMGYDDRGYSMRGGPMDHMGSGRKSRGGRGSGRSPNGQRGGMAMQHRSESPELDPEEVARNEAEKAELRQEMYAAEVQREQLETQLASLRKNTSFMVRGMTYHRQQLDATSRNLQELCRLETKAMGAERRRNCALTDLLLALRGRRRRTTELESSNAKLTRRLRELGYSDFSFIANTVAAAPLSEATEDETAPAKGGRVAKAGRATKGRGKGKAANEADAAETAEAAEAA